MAARLRDVAERAGVSVKTASNVLNNYPHIKASTRARVEQATGFLAEALGLSIDEARDVLIQDAAARGLTLGEAAERLLDREGEGDLTT